MIKDLIVYYKNVDKIEIQENYPEDRIKAIKKINATKEYISFLTKYYNEPEHFVEWIGGTPYWSENKVRDVLSRLFQEQQLLEKLIIDYLYNYIF